MGIWVDDCLITGPDEKQIKILREILSVSYAMTDEGETM